MPFIKWWRSFLFKKVNQEYVLHLDYDKMNNQLYNLKWATYNEIRAHISAKVPANLP